MTGLTTNQILSLARKKILEATTEIVSDTDLLIYLNLTLDDAVLKIFPASIVKSAAVNFTNGISTNLPADFGTLYGDPYVSETEIYPEMSIQDFTRGNYGVVIEGGVMKISPSTTPLVNIKYYPTFPALTTAVNPTIPAVFHEALLYGVIYRALEDLQDLETAAYFEAKYDKKLEEKSSALSQYEETGQRGGEMFNGISIIN